MDLALSPINNSALTIGEDGAVRLWDYINDGEMYSRNFSSKGTCISWVPYTLKNLARMAVVGYANGVVRWILLNQEGIFLLKAVKVHKSEISHLKCSPDGRIVAIVNVDGVIKNIFFLYN